MSYPTILTIIGIAFILLVLGLIPSYFTIAEIVRIQRVPTSYIYCRSPI